MASTKLYRLQAVAQWCEQLA